MSLVKDITIGEGESIPPCTKWVPVWIQVRDFIELISVLKVFHKVWDCLVDCIFDMIWGRIWMWVSTTFVILYLHGCTTFSQPLSIQTSPGPLLCPQCSSGSLKTLTVARAKTPYIEVLLISISSTRGEPSLVLIYCPLLMDCWQWNIPDTLSFTSRDIRATHHWPQLTLQFPSEESFAWSAFSAGQAFLLTPHQETLFGLTVMGLSWKPLRADGCFLSPAGDQPQSPLVPLTAGCLQLHTVVHWQTQLTLSTTAPVWSCNSVAAEASVPLLASPIFSRYSGYSSLSVRPLTDCPQWTLSRAPERFDSLSQTAGDPTPEPWKQGEKLPSILPQTLVA